MNRIGVGFIIAIVLIIGIGAVQQKSQTTTLPEVPIITDLDKSTSKVGDYNVYALDLPKAVDFAGEAVPINQPDIKERLDREFLVNTYWQSNGIMLIKRSKKYFQIIEPILAQEGVPDDFKYLAVIESGLQNVTSPAGARGFWQIMPATGKELGLEINTNVDERYHLQKATRAACKYLKQSKEQHGSWTLAAAAYNAGNAGINNELERQDVSSYYDLLLGQETGRYMFRIIALKEILKNPESYGFNIKPDQYYYQVPTQDINVDYEIENLAQFAKNKGINYKILKIHNPWLRENKLNNKSKKLYQIKIPQQGYYD